MQWNKNVLSIEGSEKIVSFVEGLVKDKAENGEEISFSFNKISPMPRELEGTSDASNWQLKHWGCRGEANNAVCKKSQNGESLHISFKTANYVPLKAFSELHRKVSEKLTDDDDYFEMKLITQGEGDDFVTEFAFDEEKHHEIFLCDKAAWQV